MIADIPRNENLVLPFGSIQDKKTVHLVDVLDASYSMHGSKYQGALKGINDSVEELKRDNTVNYTHTVVEFDSGNGRSNVARWKHTTETDYQHAAVNIMPHRHMKPMADCGPIKGYGVNGSTPLYYTICKVLENLKEQVKPGESAIVNILTDGGENTSPEKYKDGKLAKDMIEEMKAHGINTIFIGTKQDIAVVTRDTGISFMNTYAHENTGQSVNSSYNMRTQSLKSYAKGFARGASATTDAFFEEEK